jgi:hypothetical protein
VVIAAAAVILAKQRLELCVLGESPRVADPDRDALLSEALLELTDK